MESSSEKLFDVIQLVYSITSVKWFILITYNKDITYKDI